MDTVFVALPFAVTETLKWFSLLPSYSGGDSVALGTVHSVKRFVA